MADPGGAEESGITPETVTRAAPTRAPSPTLADRWQLAAVRTPFWLSLALAVAVLVPSLLLLEVRFETDDDAALTLMANGGFFGEPTARLVVMSLLAGHLLGFLYGVTNSVPWYAALTYLLYLAVLTAVIYATITHRRFRVTTHLVMLAALVAAVYVTLVTRPQYTSLAFLLAGAGVMVHAISATPKRAGVMASAAAGALVGVASLVRWDSFRGALVPGLMVLAAAARHVPWRRHLAFGLAAAALVAAGMVADFVTYQGDDAWDEYLAYNSARGAFHDTARHDVALRETELARLGWSSNDLEMFRSWFFMDRNLYSRQAIEELNAIAGSGFQNPVGVIGRRVLDHWPAAAVAAALVAIGWIRATWDERRWLLALLGATGAVTVYLASLAKLPPRIFLPLVAFVALTFVLLPGAWNGRPGVRPVPAGNNRWTVGLVALAVAAVAVAAVGLATRSSDDDAGVLLAALAENDPDAVYVVWGNVLDLHDYAPTDFRDVPDVDLVFSGWLVGSPDHDAQLERLGLEDVYLAVAERSDVYVVSRPGQEPHLFSTYLGEHYDMDGHLRPVGRLADGYDAVLYDLVVDYQIDAGGGSIVERTAAGTERSLPLAGEVAGSIEQSIDEEGWTRLSGSVQSDTMVPARALVVVEADQVVGIAPVDSRDRGADFALEVGEPLGDVEDLRLFLLDDSGAVELSVQPAT